MDRPKTMERLKKRAEFLAVAGGARASRRGFLLQSRPRGAEAETNPRFGFTVTKKMGNSPERNRIRRRLREAVRLAAADHAAAGTDYVLIGRRAALSQPFADVVRDLISGIHALKRASRPASGQDVPPGHDVVPDEAASARPDRGSAASSAAASSAAERPTDDR